MSLTHSVLVACRPRQYSLSQDDMLYYFSCGISCARVCRFALDMLKAIREFNGTGQHDPIDFRVGIANGPVVAGVVGLKRFLFDMW